MTLSTQMDNKLEQKANMRTHSHQHRYWTKRSLVAMWCLVAGCNFTHVTPYIEDLSQQAKESTLPPYTPLIFEKWRADHKFLQVGEVMESLQHLNEGFALLVGPTDTDARARVEATLYAINAGEASVGLGKIRVLELLIDQLHQETHDPESCRHKLKQLVEKRVRFIKHKYLNEKPIFFVANINTLSCTDICQVSESDTGAKPVSQQQQELCDAQVRETIDFLASTHAGFVFAVDPNTYQRHLRNSFEGIVLMLGAIPIDDGQSYLQALNPAVNASDLNAMIRLNWFHFRYTWIQRASQQMSDGKNSDDIVRDTAQQTHVAAHQLRELLNGSQAEFKQRFSAGTFVTPDNVKQNLINNVLTRINPLDSLIDLTGQNADALPQLEHEAKRIERELDVLHALGKELDVNQRAAVTQIAQQLNSLLSRLSDNLTENSQLQALQRVAQDLQRDL